MSTNEVGEILNGFDQIKLTNVYGVVVPNTDGRAGMAAVTLNDDAQVLDVERFSHYVKEQLPAYARPVFVRVQPDMDITGTFKMVKSDLRKQGYDLPTVTDPLLVMKPGSATYEPLDQAFADRIAAGEAGY